ncbi:hypothetical protein UlMin_002806 [Ulmus minor]
MQAWAPRVSYKNLETTRVARELGGYACRTRTWRLRMLYADLGVHSTYEDTCSRFHNRTPEEFITGHAPEAINIPYMYKVGSGMTKNSQILAEVSKYFRKDGCLSGKRSMIAATDLLMKFVLMFGFDFLWGYSCITDIADGYVAWTQNALPTEL